MARSRDKKHLVATSHNRHRPVNDDSSPRMKVGDNAAGLDFEFEEEGVGQYPMSDITIDLPSDSENRNPNLPSGPEGVAKSREPTAADGRDNDVPAPADRSDDASSAVESDDSSTGSGSTTHSGSGSTTHSGDVLLSQTLSQEEEDRQLGEAYQKFRQEKIDANENRLKELGLLRESSNSERTSPRTKRKPPKPRPPVPDDAVCKRLRSRINHNDENSNDENCYVCGLDGTLVCCDFCPKAFHATCLEGTPDPDDLPNPWSCKHCLEESAGVPPAPPPARVSMDGGGPVDAPQPAQQRQPVAPAREPHFSLRQAIANLKLAVSREIKRLFASAVAHITSEFSHDDRAGDMAREALQALLRDGPCGQENSLQASVEKLESENLRLKIRITALNTTNRRHEEKAAELSAKISDLEDEKRKLEEEKVQLKADADDLEDAKQKLEGEAVQLNANVSDLEDEKRKLEEEKVQLKADADDLEDAKQKLEGEAVQLNANVSDLEGHRSTLSEMVRNMEREIRNQERGATVLRASINNLETANDILVRAGEGYLQEMNGPQRGTCIDVVEMHERVKRACGGTGWFDLFVAGNVWELMQRGDTPFELYTGAWPMYGNDYLCVDHLFGRCNNKRACGRCAKGLHLDGNLITPGAYNIFILAVEWRMKIFIEIIKRAGGN